MTSSPGPPKLANATVNNQVHSGSAAVRSDVVHREAAQTSAALTKPLTSALTGNGTEPMYAGSSKAAVIAERTPSTPSSARTTTRIAGSVAGMRSLEATIGLVAVRYRSFRGCLTGSLPRGLGSDVASGEPVPNSCGQLAFVYDDVL